MSDMAAATCLLLPTLLLAGCGSTQMPAEMPSASASPTTASPSVSQDTPSPDRTTPAPGPGPCEIRDLTLTLGTGDGAAGTTYYPVVITADPGNCWLTGGVPEVYAVPVTSKAADDLVLVGPATPIPQTDPSGSVLMQGPSTASFLIGIANSDNYDTAACRPIEVAALRVGFGHPTIDVPVTAGTTVCSGDVSATGNQLSVGAIVAGNSGQ